MRLVVEDVTDCACSQPNRQVHWHVFPKAEESRVEVRCGHCGLSQSVCFVPIVVRFTTTPAQPPSPVLGEGATTNPESERAA